ncbi:class C beta-lactamase [Mycobacterium montefiorense]|nr:class C beta-lactamase [Mycobacterium montefiorense]
MVASPAAGSPDLVATTVDGAFRPLMARYGVPGIAVAVTVDGKHRYFSYGVAAKDGGAPVRPESLFEIGSLSKTFTATLVSYALALGRISLDDHPGKYLPNLLGSAVDQASLLHLGTYTAGGLPLQFPAEVTNDAQMQSYFQQWRPDAAPGQQRRYSNPSIALLGYLTAIAMNKSFTDLVQGDILPGLGLIDTYIEVPQTRMQDYAWGYSAGDEPVRVAPGVLSAEAYGVKSSAADMLRFVEANISPNSLAEPFGGAVSGTHVGYFDVNGMVQGPGWEQYRYPVSLDALLAGNSDTMAMQPNPVSPIMSPTKSGPTLFNKTGSTDGFGAYVAFVPEKRIGIVMLANKNVPNAARVSAAYTVLQVLSAQHA